MALSTSITYARPDDGLTITATDTTGAYNATTNPGGYGGVNPAVGDFTVSTISVYVPDTETLLPVETAVVIDVFPSFPSSVDGTFSITSTAVFGAEQVFPDGWYIFEWNQTYNTGGGETVVPPVTTNKILFQVVECCIKNQLVSIAGCDCADIEDKKLRLALSVSYLYMLNKRINDLEEITESIVDECEIYNKGVEMVLFMQDVCDEDNCGGCN